MWLMSYSMDFTYSDQLSMLSHWIQTVQYNLHYDFNQNKAPPNGYSPY